MMVAGRELPRSAWWTVGGIVLSVALLALGGVAYTRSSAERSDRRWCALLTTLDRQYRAAPPTTSTGQGVAAAIATLRQQFGCAP
jgi:hypothetical protein